MVGCIIFPFVLVVVGRFSGNNADFNGVVITAIVITAVIVTGAGLVLGSSGGAAVRRRADGEEQQWNTPEAIERRRLDAERRRADEEDRERNRKAEAERLAREKWAEYHRYMRIEEVDGLDGVRFERLVKTMLERTGYRYVQTTPQSGDYGADLVGDSPDGKRTVIQAKRWQGKVGISAVQEVLGALVHYDAGVAFVITNSYYTEAAKALAKKDRRIHLVDRPELARMMRAIYQMEAPEFDWDKYNQFVKNWRPL
jgi:restriction endonuclease Mrr